MEHPAIAKVFDAGTTPHGQPYLAMEYVDGLPITDYCDRKCLSIRERLRLFIQVCEGVQHAHQKAIIHRDLKPSNILVAEIDGKPIPRIIDFGLAKTILPQVEDRTLLTQQGAFLGTPGYMSPEQADPGMHDVDTRTDVYSLGIVLYELLTGTLPFDTKHWQQMRIEEALRHLRETDPELPSSKISSSTSSNSHAQARSTDAAHLAGAIRGDLDWITLKALEKDRNRRYGTASELADDLGRYLENQAVRARPASPAYRLAKYIQRNRAGVTVGASALTVLVTFAVAQSIQLKRITHERDRADRITEFMTSMFTVSNPSEARGGAITAREILDKSSNDIGKGLSNDPELQAKMMYTMAVTYRGLGLYSRAQPLQERALEIQRRVLGPQHPETLRSMNLLADTLGDEGHDAEAEKISREVLAVRRRVLGPKNPDTLRSMVTLGGTLYRQAQYAEAEKVFRDVLDLQRQVLGPEHPDTVGSMNDLASTYSQEGRNAEAVKMIRETLEIRRRILGPDHPDTLASMMNLANLLNGEAQYGAAETVCREALEIQRRVLGPDHPDTLMAMNDLATALNGTGQFAEAESLRRQTLEIRRRTLGPDHPYTLLNIGALALELSHEKRYDDAEKLFREEIEGANNTHRPGLISAAWYDSACGSAIAGHRAQALAFLRQAIDLGQPSPDDIASDSDLKSLHGDPRFEALVMRAKDRAAMLAKNATAQ